MSGVRSTARWQQLCKVLIRKASVCALCLYPLDKTAPARTPYSPSVDHIVPLSLGGAPFDASNCRVVHFGCNASRGNGTRRRRRPAQPRKTSRDWSPPRAVDPRAWLGEPKPERARWY